VDLFRADLSGARLNYATLKYAHLDGARLSRAALDGANLFAANLVDANLAGASLSSADLTGAWLSNADLNNADLSLAQMTKTRLNGADLSGANLVLAKLSGTNPRQVDLTKANLTGAKLDATDLSGADLSGAKLIKAHLSVANLSGADLSGADLTGANLTDTNLPGAIMQSANLTNANLSDANLHGAMLAKANLTGALLRETALTDTGIAGTNLTNAEYAPASEPPAPYVASIKGLDTLNPEPGEQVGLVQLRKLLQDAGLRDDERRVTDSIQRGITRDQVASSFWSLGWLWGFLRFVGFDVTTAYGLYPWRALIEILVLGFFFTFAYMQPIRRPRKEAWKPSGIYRVFPARRIDKTPSTQTVDKERVEAGNCWKAFWLAAYFSLISAVNIGFQQFTPGDWIRRLQTREYSLEPVGWVRVVAGAQALLSVYLLAIWALTQFGRPFD
jgi:uncharacterized protein YjbI with pentapeptide repeats